MRYALIATLCLSLPVLAGEDGKAKKKDRRAAVIAKKDSDGDGKLSADEFGGDAEIFALFDRNGDGFLTVEELPKPRRKKKQRDPNSQIRPGVDSTAMLKDNDKDGDGQLSAAEWPGHAKVGFEKMDKNGDGFIDKHELDTVFDRSKRGKKQRQRREPDPERMRKMAGGILKRYDQDKDGKLSPGELPQQQGRLNLAEADQNQDGFVDLLEITAVVSKRMGRQRDRDPKQMVKRLQQLDANGDGIIDKAEWKGPEPLFTRLDTDGDDQISKKELKTFAKEAGGRWNNRVADTAFRRFDADGDGKITAEEWQSRPELFQRFDANGDGVITREEITPRGPKQGRRRKMLDLKSGKDSAHFLVKFDKNRDGQVSAEEFPHERRFKEIDANGDGLLSETEIKDSMDKMHREEEYGFFERFDLNTDGKITRDEFTGAAAIFEKMDKNNDGVIDKLDGLDK